MTSPTKSGRLERVSDHVVRVRSKNAGPFHLTIDLFCTDARAYQAIVSRLPTRTVAGAFNVAEDQIRRFELPTLDVVKFSLQRPGVQGAADDRDMHGAQWGVLVAQLALEP